ncbi:MAG TPA: hypothetical protein PLB81_05365 [Deltaproteobacteria bacterium]|nr:hypothetical protein [Deltaproteobacteria bacterium]
MKALLNRFIILCVLGGICYLICSRMAEPEHECRGCVCGCNREA